MYSKKNHIVGHDDKGWFIGQLMRDIIQRKHRITKQNAIDIIIKWANE